MTVTRRRLLASGLAASAATLARPPFAFADGAPGGDERILVALELSGGNDGLNCIVPYGDDNYYDLRPGIGLKPDEVLQLDDHWGMNPGMRGMQRLWDDGQLAVIHGCGYAQPSYSHFTSMAYWHTASPNSGDAYGWMGRLADAMVPEPRPNFLVNVADSQSLAVNARIHTPVVFDDPARFRRDRLPQEGAELGRVDTTPTGNSTRDFLNQVARSATDASARIRGAWARYASPVDYGLVPVQLDKVAACIAAGLPARLYYVSFPNNAFDTHVQQPALHQRLLSYASDALHGFIRDLERLGQADRVTVMVFSEFGRRARENTNRGTDHGTANVMFMAGRGVRGGHYGEPPALDALDAGDNLVFTTDFRRVYASAIDGWLGTGAATEVLKGEFAPLPVFA